jgi:hypothetical protein
MTPKTVLLEWLFIAGLGTIIIGFTYVAAQQDLRQGANDPQIQIAEDTARVLERGGDPREVLAQTQATDIAESLAPYLVVFDASGKPIAGSGLLDGNLPTLPADVFDYAKSYGEDRLTWQPQADVRSALVIVPYGGTQPGFVLAGRSLREVEKREGALSSMAFLAWCAMVFVAFIGFILTLHVHRNRI